jgi:hypothetical protein
MADEAAKLPTFKWKTPARLLLGRLGLVDAARKSGRHSVLLHMKSGDTMKFVAVPAGRG